MRLLMNDYAGHEFPLQLSGEFVDRGISVVHSYCASNTTPHGDFAAAGRKGVELQPIDLGRTFEKHRIARRALDEIDYGIRSSRQLLKERPDHVVAAQFPVLSLVILTLTAKAARIPLTLWLQDIQWVIARSTSPVVGSVLGWFENFAIRRAENVVTISDGMADIAAESGRRRSAITVIENWADVDKIRPGARENPWAKANGLVQTTNFVYSGTLGIKHRPEALVALAEMLSDDPAARVVVVSAGAGTDRLTQIASTHDVSNLVMLPLQRAEDLPDVLATGDVLLALLEEDAADGCVPSKILAYLAAGRPVLGLMPESNLASEVIQDRAGAGYATQTQQAFLASAQRLARDPRHRESLGSCGRQYAVDAFDIATNTDRFLQAVAPTTTVGEIHASTT